MPLGDFEKELLRLLAANRNPESYIAGATVFLRRDDSHRQSQDIDVFHDTVKSLKKAATQDATVLQSHGYALEWVEHQESLQRATISKGGHATKVDWAYDSAFRFFPVQPDVDFGFVLHPLDGATNKLLALAGRGELRDYLDVLFLHRKVLPLGALAWAACGKDVGFTPQFLIEEAQRLAHYPAARLKTLLLREPVDLVECKREWLTAVAEANALFMKLPPEEIGCLYLDAKGQAVTPDPATPEFKFLSRHFGSVSGAWPTINLD
ncbi:MAG TPA: nucleotidyl transferase AbiEii/AbiGii toxin family protein [Verrucomicrobiae bacterium]|nr:nucleotidyl transferase AbiEii/AbiGii toxin family protein [Verrucomicrobiae bacterium]